MCLWMAQCMWVAQSKWVVHSACRYQRERGWVVQCVWTVCVTFHPSVSSTYICQESGCVGCRPATLDLEYWTDCVTNHWKRWRPCLSMSWATTSQVWDLLLLGAPALWLALKSSNSKADLRLLILYNIMVYHYLSAVLSHSTLWKLDLHPELPT